MSLVKMQDENSLSNFDRDAALKEIEQSGCQV